MATLRRAIGGLSAALVMLAVTATFASAPRVTTERVGGKTRIVIEVPSQDGSVDRSVLRETDADVTIRRSGSGPTGKAMFASWEEAGSRWMAYSRDGGASWSDSRAIETRLRLRAGDVAPGAPMPAAPSDLAMPGDGRLFVVQFETIGLPEWRAALADAGVEVLAHVPHNAHIVRGDRASIGTIARLSFVDRVEPYHPAYRLSEELLAWLDGTGEPELRVRAMSFEWGPVGKGRIVERAEALGARVAAIWPSGHVVELFVDRDQLRGLAASDDVLWIDRWSPPESDMDFVREDAGTDWVETNFGYCGAGVRGEVLDGGIQLDHPDFDGIMVHGETGVDSHGTSTYGIVFGNGDRDGDGNARGTGHLTCAEQGITADYGFLTDRFAHTEELKNPPYQASFQTNSWGSAQTTSYTSDSFDMDDIIWRLDIAILNSQSNTGNRNSRPQAWAKNVISVGGMYHYDTLDIADDAWNGGASIGPAADGRIKPDVAYWYDSILTTTTGSGYANFGGTSAATPESAGVLGLILEMWSDNVWNTDPQGGAVFERQPHASTLKALLINNAQQYDFVGSDADLSRYKQGWGRPSARVAYERAASSLVVDEEVVLGLGENVVYDVEVPPGETELKVTMAYPDPPGTTSASMHRINDVNLKVTSPSATVYHGNVGLEEGNESTPGGSPDTLNTVENVFVRSPTPGTWQIEIDVPEINQDAHLDTPEDDVVFALVVTGATGQYSDAASVRFERASYACGQPLTLQVLDGNVGASTVQVDVWSSTETTPETVTLSETAPGKFVGDIPTTSAAPTPGDGVLSISHGDVLTIEYIDADDGAGGIDVPRQDTADTDCVDPVISGVATSNVTDVSATITWTTDERATRSVQYGETPPPTEEATGPGLVTVHTVELTSLQACTVYYYSVTSGDLVGNVAVDDDGGAYYNFETLGDFGQGLQPCREGRVTIDVDTVACSSSLPVTLVDQDLNLDPVIAETVVLPVTSTTEPFEELAVLTETGPNTSIFEGAMTVATGDAVPDDGILQVAHADLITVTYRDADDGAGSARTSFDTATADCIGAVHDTVEVTDVTATDATIRWTTSKSTTGEVHWGTSPELGNVAVSDTPGTSHSVQIAPIEECGTVYFRVISTDPAGNVTVADAEGQPFTFNAATLQGIVFQDGFESANGWTLEGEWEIDAPLGLGTAPGDPTAATDGIQVLGHDLTGLGAAPGDYEINVTQSATGPVADLSALTAVELRFDRWLNVETSGNSFLQVKDTAGVWQTVWSSNSATSSSWSTQVYDVTSWAAGNPSFQVRFQQSSRFGRDAGWNVDRLFLRDASQPTWGACGGCAGSPAFAGAVEATDDDACADSGITVRWSPAAAWGTGNGGTYAVYRDVTPDFTPTTANRVASGVTGTSWTDPSPPAGTPLYYIVRAENDETCAAGPNNGGTVDGNVVRVSASNETSQPDPGDLGDSLRVEPVNGAHTRLTWISTGTAATYHVYRSSDPASGFTQVASPVDPLHEDEGVLLDGATWFYTVVAADACGNEGAP